jgi:predicted helicase
VQLLVRVIGSIEPSRITRNRGENPWLYFYEEFLSAYDPALRKRVGAYYTPRQVVHAQIRLVSELLTGSRLGKSAIGGGFADPGVIILDPAAGTGTYPLAVLEHAAASVPANRLGQVGSVISDVAANLYAFELMAGPYAVTHLRLSQEIADRRGATPAHGVQVFLANTLDSHESPDQGVFPAMYREVGREREEARRVKADTHVVVCVGNPPYFRGKATGGAGEGAPGGWVQWRVPPVTETVATKAPVSGTAQQPRATTRRVHTPGVPGILEDFLAPARDAGLGGHLKNLYNDYVYFWRWALWKVFEHAPTAGSPPGAGVVSFVTASSYLRGPAFAGMRQHMRASFDELWIIDLGGDNKGARTSDNVFAIETPVCIAIGVRYGAPDPQEPSKTHYTSVIDGSRREKYERLDAVSSFADFEWRECMSGWQAPFLPADNATYFGWPELADLFPWQTNGLSFFRSWPIGESRAVLEQRWAALVADLPIDQRTGNPLQDRARLQQQREQLFKESRDRRIDKSYPALDGVSAKPPAIADLPAGTPPPPIERIAFRSLDRQWAILDNRVGDYLRPELRQTAGERQLFLTSLGLADVLGRGPAAMATALLPDYHVFNGRGGQHVVPLWRDAAGLDPNVTTGLLDALGAELGRAVSAEELFAYCYGILSANAYVDRFWDELTVPGLRIPLTADPGLFAAAVDAGRHMIRLHTYGERCTPDGQQPGRVPEGTATYAVGVPNQSGGYPKSFSYDPRARQLHVGAGRYDEVAPEVWDYAISGWQVVDRWLGYRMPVRAGKKSSRLDDIRPEKWPDADGEELLRLLWIIEHTLAAQADLAGLLTEVVSGATIKAADLPAPSPEDRRPPPAREADGVTQADGLFAVDAGTTPEGRPSH